MKYIRLIIIFASAVMIGVELSAIFRNPELDLSDPMTFKRPAIFVLIILIGIWGFYKDKKRNERMNNRR